MQSQLTTSPQFGDPRLPERFWAKARVMPNGCWEWVGAKNAPGMPNTNGYGIFRWQSKVRKAHRVAYQVLVGPFPTGKEADHLCRNRPCVNPTHIEPVTQHENMSRGLAWLKQRIKTHCPQGHPYSIDNTYRWRSRRHCKVCRREATKRWRHRWQAH